MHLHTLGAAIGYSSGKNNSNLNTPPEEMKISITNQNEVNKKEEQMIVYSKARQYRRVIAKKQCKTAET